MANNIRCIYPSEHDIQSAIVEWASLTKIPNTNYFIKDFLIKIPNEGKRSWTYSKKMKKEGLKKGVSDLFLAYPVCHSLPSEYLDKEKKNIYCGFWLEIKKKGENPTIEQSEFLYLMKKIGYFSDWRDTVDEGIKAIKEYLGI